ncbi:MAG: single-stranded DNA-binding protein [Actinomycetota bacterium]|nr:single-stranded DNA-binding protein [Actinomycetota bacterium]
MNAVSLIGTLSTPPDLQEPDSDPPRCTMQIAVPRRSRSGIREPGIVYVSVTIFGLRARECADRLKLGSRIGLAGRLDSADPAGILIDQLDYL